MATRQWRELVHVIARYHEPDLEIEHDHTIEVWWPSDNPNITFVQLEAMPMWLGSSPRYDGYSLVADCADSEGRREFYGREREALKRICDAVRLDGAATVSVLTVWACEAGTTYVPGEPDEYVADAQLVGYLHPETFVYVEAADAPR